jgi:uncharacterized membrane protein YeaQ/YmgE (transglycosylase-associated protein family)
MTFTILDVVVLILIAGICGAIGQAITGYSAGGIVVSVVLGFIGALLGLWLARAMNLPEPLAVQVGDVTFPILWSIVGAALFVAVISFLTRRNYYPRD